MIKILFTLMSVVVLTICLASPAFAFGDEHRNNYSNHYMGTGDGQGDQVQNQHQKQVNIGN